MFGIARTQDLLEETRKELWSLKRRIEKLEGDNKRLSAECDYWAAKRGEGVWIPAKNATDEIRSAANVVRNNGKIQRGTGKGHEEYWQRAEPETLASRFRHPLAKDVFFRQSQAAQEFERAQYMTGVNPFCPLYGR